MNFPYIFASADTLLDQIRQQEKGTVDSDTLEIITDGATLGESIAELKGSTSLFVIDFMEWGSIIIAALFILGVIMMLVSIMFRNGQWQKWGQGTMLMSFLALLAIRAIPIVILSFRSESDINDALTDGLSVLSQVAIYLCVLGILISFLFRFAHALIKHPDYHRWSKNVLNVSIIMLFISIIGPYIFKF